MTEQASAIKKIEWPMDITLCDRMMAVFWH